MSSNDMLSAESLQRDERKASEDRARRADSLRRVLQNLGVFVPFVVVLVAGIAIAPNFLSPSNITNMLVNASILAIVGFGMTVVIAVRGIDLSVGSAQALTCCLVAASVNGFGPLGGIAVGLIAGAVLGLINGLVTTKLRVPGFITTLSTMSVYRGAALIFTAGAPIIIDSVGFKGIATTSVAGIPLPFLLALLVGLAFWFVLERMRSGRYVIAVGSNPEGAIDSGIDTQRVILGAYVFSGVCAGLAGVVLASQLGVINASVSNGLELRAIAIVVLGGTSMAGGRARVVGTAIAALLLSMINSGLNLLNVISAYQYVALGVLLVLALGIDSGQRAAVRRMLEGRGTEQ
jgi:ribose/xylose/arabinose/galactoside ABC-type transport system permease subunit